MPKYNDRELGTADGGLRPFFRMPKRPLEVVRHLGFLLITGFAVSTVLSLIASHGFILELKSESLQLPAGGGHHQWNGTNSGVDDTSIALNGTSDQPDHSKSTFELEANASDILRPMIAMDILVFLTLVFSTSVPIGLLVSSRLRHKSRLDILVGLNATAMLIVTSVLSAIFATGSSTVSPSQEKPSISPPSADSLADSMGASTKYKEVGVFAKLVALAWFLVISLLLSAALECVLRRRNLAAARPTPILKGYAPS